MLLPDWGEVLLEGHRRPGEQHQREVPGDDGADDADRLPVRHLGVHELCPAGVVIEVPDDHRNVGVPRLSDGLAIVQSLDDGDQP